MKETTRQGLLHTVCAVTSLLVLGWAQSASAQSSGSYNQYEKEALKVVQAWDEAWKTKDPEKIAQYMTEDVIIRDPSVQKESGTGRQKFISAYKKLMTGINYYEVTSRFAAGDAMQTVVVEKRRDHVTMNGKEQILNFVGYFRVMNGKIVEWADVAIVRPPGMEGPPPSVGN